MIAIDNVLLSEELIHEHFVCDLQKCKGGCCVDGDCGAPLTDEETKTLTEIYPKIKPYLSPEYVTAIEEQGTHIVDDEFGNVTPTINGGICAYGYIDGSGVVKCGIEKAWKEGIIAFRKPISCHLFPIRIKEYPGYEAVNYEPRPTLCRPACNLGNKLKVPVYQFLKDAIIRKYGEEFYETLDAVAKKYSE
ncbi:MAG TPA: DUF3109 family protein [Flavipsychrobacter sp.]|nr:DUF3109 family protein [Flavipsychrobacter sp.]